MKRYIQSKSRTMIALTALVALGTVAAVRLNTIGLAQDPVTPAKVKKSEPQAERGGKKTEEAPVRSEEKAPGVRSEPKKSDAPAPGRKGDEKKPDEPKAERGKPEPAAVKKTEPQPEGRVKKTEEAPVKPGEKAPMKGDEKVPGVRPEPKKGDVEVPGRKGDEKKPDEPRRERGKPVSGDEKKDPTGGKRPDGTPGKEKPRDGEKGIVEGLPEDFSDQQRLIYRSLKEPELSFEEYLEFSKLEFVRRRALEKNPASMYRPGSRGRGAAALNTPCGNGDFEPGGLNSAEWSGAFGTIGSPLTSGISPGNSSGLITSAASRQTLVSAGTDPNVPIQRTGPNTNVPLPLSSNAMRIGNAVNGFGTELLSKTFTVTSSDTLIRFWYAVVMENPLGHPANIQPYFEVRVLESGVAIPGLVNLGNGSSKLVADSSNPFFQIKAGPTPIVFKDWSCAQINLSQQVGKTVTVEFVTQDCGAGGHWGYAYIDDICGTCLNSPAGDIQFDPGTSTTCGKGQICFQYTLPHTQNAAGNITGTGVITLDIYQNGGLVPVLTLPQSPTLTTGTSYCFPIDATTLSGLSSGGAGFDFVATGTFTLGSNVQVLTVGTVPDGRVTGQNNDYAIKCIDKPPVAQGCCLGENLVKNGGFELDGPGPESEYHNVDVGPGLVPGTYTVTDVDLIGKACRNWQLPKACAGTKDFTGHVMLVNGLTNQIAPAPATAVIWQQKLDLPSGDKKSQYRVCFRYLPLPACCFDIPAKPYVVVEGDGAIVSGSEVDVDTGCGHLYSATVEANGAINLQIVLPQNGMGDGNDLLIDNISVAKLVKVPGALLVFGFAPDAATHQVTVTVPAGLTSPPYMWQWEIYTGATNGAGGTLVSPPITGNAATHTFTGLAQNTLYTFKLKAWSDCHMLTGYYQDWNHGPLPSARKAMTKPVEDPNPEPVKIKKEPQTPNRRAN